MRSTRTGQVKIGKTLSFTIVPMLCLSLVLGCNLLSDPLPEGREGKEAERLAERMLRAVDHEAWDSTRFVSWNMIGHRFLWDKEREFVRVEWSDRKVLLRQSDQSGVAYEDGEKLSGEEKEEALQEAWAHFCNDSFWLIAPNKIFDPGTERKLVESDSGESRLLVTYTSGGVTPGDSYLWILGEDGRPERYKMWVSQIPIGGTEASWEDWDTLSTGALVAKEHALFIGSLKVKELRAAQGLQELGIEEDPFRPLKKRE